MASNFLRQKVPKNKEKGQKSMTSDLKKCGDPYGTRTQLSSRKPVENTGFFQSVVFLVVFAMAVMPPL